MLGRIANKDSSRKRRRSVVVLMYLGILAVPGFFLCWGMFVPRDLAPGRWAALVIVFGALVSAAVSSLILVTLIALRASTQSIVETTDDSLDERQRTIRDGAYRTAYNILTRAGLLSFLISSLIALVFGWDRTFSWLSQETAFMAFMAISYTFVWLSLTLPTATVAWTEPDPEEEEMTMSLKET